MHSSLKRHKVKIDKEKHFQPLIDKYNLISYERYSRYLFKDIGADCFLHFEKNQYPTIYICHEYDIRTGNVNCYIKRFAVWYHEKGEMIAADSRFEELFRKHKEFVEDVKKIKGVLRLEYYREGDMIRMSKILDKLKYADRQILELAEELNF